MKIEDFSHLEGLVRRECDNVVVAKPALAGLIRDLLAAGRVVVFGGFVRDRLHAIIHGERLVSRDIDLVIDGKVRYGGTRVGRNNFGGYRQQLDSDLRVDYWELSSTYAFTRGLFEAKLENLPKTTVYSVNACFYDLVGQRLVEHRAVDAVAQKVIEFNCVDYLDVFPDYQAFRAIDLARRLGYSLAPDVELFVRARLAKSSVEQFVVAVKKHRPEVRNAALRALHRKYRGAGT